MSPKAEWQRIAGETTEPAKVLTSYVVPLALIGPIASLIGMQVFGINAVIVTFKPSLASYARVAYARELTGDLAGAASAMRLALEASGGEPEPTAWALVASGVIGLRQDQ